MAAFGGERQLKNLVGFVSGGGSNLRCIHEACLNDRINGRFTLVVTSKPDCGGADYARTQGLPVLVYPAPEKSPADLMSALLEAGADYILLAGYLKLVPTEVVQAFPGQILNIHPGPLPEFGGKGYFGLRVHIAVLDSGRSTTEVTIHYVDERYDHGQTIATAPVHVQSDDTPEVLAARVLKVEHKLFPAVIAALCGADPRFDAHGRLVLE